MLLTLCQTSHLLIFTISAETEQNVNSFSGVLKLKIFTLNNPSLFNISLLSHFYMYNNVIYYELC